MTPGALQGRAVPEQVRLLLESQEQQLPEEELEEDEAPEEEPLLLEEELEEEVTQIINEGSMPTSQLPLPLEGQQERLKILQSTIPSGTSSVEQG